MAIGVLTLGIAMSACKSEEPPPAKEVVRPVKTYTVVSANQAIDQTFPAQVRAGRRVDLAFKVAGPLVEGPIEEGQQVKKGQVIAKILPRDFKINLDQAQARTLEAEQQYKRYKDLYVRKQVSKAEDERNTWFEDLPQYFAVAGIRP
jgi:multidrug efflux pump subunit AcrA (membrane-fusion protein)